MLYKYTEIDGGSSITAHHSLTPQPPRQRKIPWTRRLTARVCLSGGDQGATRTSAIWTLTKPLSYVDYGSYPLWGMHRLHTPRLFIRPAVRLAHTPVVLPSQFVVVDILLLFPSFYLRLSSTSPAARNSTTLSPADSTSRNTVLPA